MSFWGQLHALPQNAAIQLVDLGDHWHDGCCNDGFILIFVSIGHVDYCPSVVLPF